MTESSGMPAGGRNPAVVVRRLRSGDVDDTLIGQAAVVLRRLVADGAALGWVDPPHIDEVAALVREVGAAVDRGDACLVTARVSADLAGLGYWLRYARPTHRPHADLEKIAVAPAHQGRGIGRRLVTTLVDAAVAAGIEVLTLDFRGDNARAGALYRALGFSEYGRLPGFVAVGSARYDKVFYARDLRDGQPRSADGSRTRSGPPPQPAATNRNDRFG